MQVTVKRGVIARLSGRGASVRKEHGPLIANALMHLVNDGCFVAIYPVLPLIAKEFHLSYTQVGFLKTALSGSSTALQLPMAMLAEPSGGVTLGICKAVERAAIAAIRNAAEAGEVEP